MLKYAKPYENELKIIFNEIAFDMHYKYGLMSVYREELKIPESTWEGHHFVSIHNDKIIGYISYGIDRIQELAYNFAIYLFNEKYCYTFTKDVLTVVDDIFSKFGFRKLNFSCAIGNKPEIEYDRFVKRVGGRIVGYREKEVRLIDGQYYDLKLYEILATNYLEKRREKI